MDENERKYGDDVPVMAGDVVRESGCRATMTAVSATEDGTGVLCRFYEPTHPDAVKLATDADPVVPVRYLDLSEGEAHALALADNRIGELATWDDEGLASVLTELRDVGTEIGGLGWDEAGLDAVLSPDRAPDSGNRTPDPALPEGMQYRVLVKVADENAQVALIERLEAEGYACQPLIS